MGLLISNPIQKESKKTVYLLVLTIFRKLWFASCGSSGLFDSVGHRRQTSFLIQKGHTRRLDVARWQHFSLRSVGLFWFTDRLVYRWGTGIYTARTVVSWEKLRVLYPIWKDALLINWSQHYLNCVKRAKYVINFLGQKELISVQFTIDFTTQILV